ncbi:hypothetical protein L596_004882 [Steinernema carpocapsae]|uniref:Uncharacterized protein n=1 Tax=Steinernema carpocapsae TaxID=34508 RepID=A0A4U8UYT1_STECR|nr:hypothetical protein L596_004882 [Steinernema carpocapsae]
MACFRKRFLKACEESINRQERKLNVIRTVFPRRAKVSMFESSSGRDARGEREWLLVYLLAQAHHKRLRAGPTTPAHIFNAISRR